MMIWGALVSSWRAVLVVYLRYVLLNYTCNKRIQEKSIILSCWVASTSLNFKIHPKNSRISFNRSLKLSVWSVISAMFVKSKSHSDIQQVSSGFNSTVWNQVEYLAGCQRNKQVPINLNSVLISNTSRTKLELYGSN